MGKSKCTRKKVRKQPYKSKRKGQKLKQQDESQNTEEKIEEKPVKSCHLCRGKNEKSDFDICDRCQKYFCLECVKGKPWRYECDENDLSYHHFCSRKCVDKWIETNTFPCDGGCIQLLSRRKQPYSRFWGNYLNPFFW